MGVLVNTEAQGGPMTITSGVETISPAIAEEWLGLNHHNRNLDRVRVAQYTAAMKRGDWSLNGEAIKFDGPLGLLDGQNRLAAVVASGVEIQSVVIRGLPPEAQETMDRGKARTIADVLHLRGEMNSVTLAAALAWLHRFNTGTMRSNPAKMSAQDTLRLLDANPEMRVMGPVVESLRRYKLMNPSLAWCLAYRFTRLDYDDAVDFFDKLADGAGLGEDDPILRLRNNLVQQVANQRVRRLQPWIVAAMAIKAWNCYRDGTTIGILKFVTGGAHPEAYPEPR